MLQILLNTFASKVVRFWSSCNNVINGEPLNHLKFKSGLSLIFNCLSELIGIMFSHCPITGYNNLANLSRDLVNTTDLLEKKLLTSQIQLTIV